MKKALVLGGTRFFGVHLVNDLLERGMEVTVATRGIRKDEFHEKVKRIVFDRTDENSIKEKLDNHFFDFVYDDLAYSSNDIEILLPHLHCSKYIVVSSTAVYDPLQGEVRETDFDASEIFYENKKKDKNQYAYGKRLVEAAILQKYPDVHSIIVRFPFVIGIDDYTNRLYQYIESFMTHSPLYIDNLKATMSFIDSKDAGRFLGSLSDLDDFTGVINGANQGVLSIYQIFEYLSESLNLDFDEEIYADRTLKSAPYNGTKSYRINTDKAKELGIELADINSWIYDLIDAYVEMVEKNIK